MTHPTDDRFKKVVVVVVYVCLIFLGWIVVGLMALGTLWVWRLFLDTL